MTYNDQLELFPGKKLELWTEFPNLRGFYYQSDEDKETTRRNFDEWKRLYPEEAAKFEQIMVELKTKLNEIIPWKNKSTR